MLLSLKCKVANCTPIQQYTEHFNTGVYNYYTLIFHAVPAIIVTGSVLVHNT